MKAAVLTEIGSSLTIMDVPMPEINANEVLIKTKACGICGTDIHMIHGWGYTPVLPHIPGHEPAGIVVKVGEQVKSLRPGDRVVPNIFQSCGKCEFCLRGRETLCRNLSGITGVLSQGAFAEYFKASGQNLFILPDDVDFPEGCVIADAVVTAVHAVKRAKVSSRDTAAVIGIGGVGQCIISLLKHLGATVFAFDINEEKLKIAGQLGANKILDMKIPVSIDYFQQCDSVFDCVGKKNTLEETVTHIKQGGTITLVGYENEKIEISPQLIAQKELRLQGSRSGTKLDTFEAIDYVQRGIIMPCISNTFELKDINQALQLLENGRALGRVVITF